MLIVKQPQGFVISQTLNHKNNNNKISMVKQYLRCDIFSNFTLFSHKYIYFNVTHNYKKKGENEILVPHRSLTCYSFLYYSY